MILATDTHYTDTLARTAGVLFSEWTDEAPAATHVVESTEVADYEPGSFYKRELPLILKLLEVVDPEPETIVIDGYVQLDEGGRKGLGAHLFDSLGGRAGGECTRRQVYFRDVLPRCAGGGNHT